MKLTPELLFDSNRGQYIPRDFATEIDYRAMGLTDDDVADLKDPDGEWYWDCWTRVLDNARWTDPHGIVWYLWQDGDVWLVPEGYDDEDFFGDSRL